MERKTFKTQLAGQDLTFEFGRFAEQANGACLCTFGGTVVLATAVSSIEPIDRDFMPLMINYEERLYAGGKIKGSRFIKREGRPSDDNILCQRVIDRSLRPLFDKHMRNDTQVITTILAFDKKNSPDMVAGLAASAALAVSDIPWAGPIAMGRVSIVDDKLVIMPTKDQIAESPLDLVIATTPENVVMIEAGANEVPEDKMIEALEFGKAELVKVASFISDFTKEIGSPKFEIEFHEPSEAIVSAVTSEFESKITEALAIDDKTKRERARKILTIEIKKQFADKEGIDPKDLAALPDIIFQIEKRLIRTDILDSQKRMGGRKMDEVRPLTCEAGIFAELHGSAIFQRGETQGLTTVTVGAPGDAQLIENLSGEYQKSYIHHYYFPPFSVGEVSGRLMANNRAIGHGALAERALLPMIPPKADFPYTLRLVTEILSSNGSSSMASVCGSTMALMDAGVPIKKPVAGVAMGMVATPDLSKFEILTDLQGEEDYTGDMDFKVAGTKDGITAIQMDIKVKGLTPAIFTQALEQAKSARLFILEKMLEAIPEVRPEMSDKAPRIVTVQIDPDKIGAVIGKGGDTIHKLQDDNEVQIDINEDGLVFITSTNNANDGAAKTKKLIETLTYEPKPGDTFDAKVIKIMDFGAFVEFLPGKEGLVHISQLANQRVEKVRDIVKEGDMLKVKVMEIDDRGRINLSHKATLGQSSSPKPTPKSAPDKKPEPPKDPISEMKDF